MADPFDEGPSKAAPAPPKKKSLFSNSSWSKPQEPEDGIEFFSRAKELYPIQVAEEERKRKKKVAKQKQERKRSTASAERKDSSTPELKRQRLSSEAADGENSSDNSPSNQLLNDAFSSHSKLAYDTLPTDYVSRTRSPGSPVTHSARCGKGLNTKPEAAAKQKPISENYIALSDSEDVGRVVKSGAGQAIILLDDDDDIHAAERIISQFEEEDPQMSDEEFPELVQRARERERQKEQERLNTAMAFAGKNHVNELTVSAVDDVFQDISAPEVDPIVEILVTSYMEGTNPLLVRRRLNQRLKEVRLSWCDKQFLQGVPLPPQLRASVFLTWNGKRLFDASTCKHLGVKLGTDGKFSTEGDGFDDNGRLHFEAWTEDLFIAYQRQNQLQQDGVENEPEPEPAQEPSGRIKLLLKARDMEPFRLRVKPTTSVEKMALAFRTDKNIPKEKEIALYFDGDRLDPALRVADSELDDMDTIEVHIR